MDVTIAQDKTLQLKVLQFCFYLTILSNLIIFMAQPLDITMLETLASRCLMLSNLTAFFLVINHSIKHYIRYQTTQIVILVFMISFSFLSYMLSSSSGIYNYVIRLWCYLALPFYFLYIDYLKPNKKMINYVFFINFLTTFVFTALSFSKYKYAGYESYIGTDSAWLTLGYANPNQTAMYLLVIIIILFCAFHYYTKRLARLFILMDIIYMAVLLVETSSRTCILIGILITAMILLKKKYTISKYVVIGILLLPTVIMFVYPYLYNNGWIYLIEFGGKADYSSRSYIFSAVLSAVKDQFLLGNFSTYQLQNIHNGPLSIYASLGLVGLILYYIYCFRAYFNILLNGIKSKTSYISFIGLLAVFLHACTEGAFLIGGSMYAGILSVLIFLVKLDGKDVK